MIRNFVCTQLDKNKVFQKISLFKNKIISSFLSILFHQQGESWFVYYINQFFLSGNVISFLFLKIILQTDGFSTLVRQNKSFLMFSFPVIKQVFDAAVVRRILITCFFLV